MEKIALVTGAARGIGRAVAIRLARDGWAVCINYIAHRDEAETLAAELTAAGGRAIAVQGDVSDPGAVARLVKRTQTELGQISLLVNNAGISCDGQFQDITGDRWRRCFAVNVDGVFHCTQAVLPGMLHEKAGCIVNLASIWGLRGASCEVPYAAAKAAVIGMTRSLALELAPSGIRVNAVAPGCIETDMLGEYDAATRAELCAQTPLGRLGTPADIAAAVAFFASGDASFLTGQILTADGGFIG
ncbi:MAG: 3-oxoacyl-ACP reductase FabG [Oscillospiraceae bacterium]